MTIFTIGKSTIIIGRGWEIIDITTEEVRAVSASLVASHAFPFLHSSTCSHYYHDVKLDGTGNNVHDDHGRSVNRQQTHDDSSRAGNMMATSFIATNTINILSGHN
jgi:hypothetical protein